MQRREMRKVQKKPAHDTRCKRGDSKIHKKKPACSSAIRIARSRAEKVAQKKRKKVVNVRARAGKALQQGRPYTPNTEDAKLKKIAADVRRSIKKADNADKKSDAATATANRCQRLCNIGLERQTNIELRQNATDRNMMDLERQQAIAEHSLERRMEETELRWQGLRPCCHMTVPHRSNGPRAIDSVE